MRRILLALAALCLAAAGCASVTDGAGRQGASGPSPSAPGSSYRGTYAPLSSLPEPPSLSQALPPGSPFSPGVPMTVSHTPSEPPATSPPPAAVPPAICRSGGCIRNREATLDGGYGVVLWTGAARGGASGASIIELTQGGRAVWWQVTAERIGGDLRCSPRPVPNCVVVDGAGAHASIATGYLRRGSVLVRTGSVESDTPNTDPADLDGDGLIDVVTAINTYEPTYATGTVYWQTFRGYPGAAFRSTGCTPPAQLLPPEPTRLLTGSCPS